MLSYLKFTFLKILTLFEVYSNKVIRLIEVNYNSLNNIYKS